MKFHVRLISVLRELRRRKVFRVGSVYLVTAWGASLGAAELFPAFGLPDGSVRMFVFAAILGLPVAMALAWIYELSEQGIERDIATDRASQVPTRMPLDVHLKASWQTEEGPQERVFRDSFHIGRATDCELHLDDQMVSRRHARVFFERGLWQIEDLGSRNGTTVNGKPVTRESLPDDCELQFYPEGGTVRLTSSPNPVATVAYLEREIGSHK